MKWLTVWPIRYCLASMGWEGLGVQQKPPRFAEMEAKYGSLGRAMLAARHNDDPASHQGRRTTAVHIAEGRDEQMVDTIVSRLPGSVLHTGTPVQAIQQRDGGWLVSAGFHSDHFDAVIVAVPTPVASGLIRMTVPELATELAASITPLQSR